MKDSHAENIVVKVGGASLFSQSSLVGQIRSVITPPANQRMFVLFGGGDTVESMRSLHTLYPHLDSAAMHWRCVQLLDATWEVACELFPEGNPAPTWEALQQGTVGPSGSLYLVRAAAFYAPQSLSRIPCDLQPAANWNTTSDVLSWILATLVGAAELRIAKRCPVESDMTIREAATAGMIDSELARLVSDRPHQQQPKIRFVHLREPPCSS